MKCIDGRVHGSKAIRISADIDSFWPYRRKHGVAG
jgi:hypothetical protein